MIGQFGMFDGQNRYGKIDAHGDPLKQIDDVVDWEVFRKPLEKAWRRPDTQRKSKAGRKPWDSVLMFKTLVLCALYNLSDDQLEYQVLDRMSFMRFLGLGVGDPVPDAKTVWHYREALIQAGKFEELFGVFDGFLHDQGWRASGGQIIDASIVPTPKQRNTVEENKSIKEGKTPEKWKKNPNMLRRKDLDARWVKKRDENHYGYKNHVNVDCKHKLVRCYEVTDASVHDSQVLYDVLDYENNSADVWADSAYRSAEIEKTLAEAGFRSKIQHKGYRNKPLSDDKTRANTVRSRVRTRVEHVFGSQKNDMGGTLVRSVGLTRAKARIGLKNLAYNMRRLVYLERTAEGVG